MEISHYLKKLSIKTTDCLFHFESFSVLLEIDLNKKNIVEEIGFSFENKLTNMTSEEMSSQQIQVQRELEIMCFALHHQNFYEWPSLMMSTKTQSHEENEDLSDSKEYPFLLNLSGHLLFEIQQKLKGPSSTFVETSPVKKLLCRCFGVGVKEVQAYLKENPSSSLDETARELKASLACSTCQDDLEQEIDYFRSFYPLFKISDKAVQTRKRKRIGGLTPAQFFQEKLKGWIDSHAGHSIEVISFDGHFLWIKPVSEDVFGSFNQQLAEEMNIQLRMTS